MKPVRLLAFDLIFLALFFLATCPPLAGVLYLASWVPGPSWLVGAFAPVGYVLFILGLAVMLRLIRLFIPRLQPGSYAFPGHPQAIAWLAHFALQRIGNLVLWHRFYMSLTGLRYVMLRALGAKVAFDMNTSNDTRLLDPSLTEVGAGAMLGAGTVLAGHLVENGRLVLAPVTVAPGAQVMGGATIAPGVVIEANAVVGPGTKVLPRVHIGEDVFIGVGCSVYNDVKLGASAIIGHQVTIEHKVVVGEHAVVRPYSVVPKGTVIPEGGSFPE